MVPGQMSEPEGSELLTAARQGSLDALQQLFALYEAGLFRLLYRMLGCRADAQDLLQECDALRGAPPLGSPSRQLAANFWLSHELTNQRQGLVRSPPARPA